jgi:hypothetical protein
MALISSSVTPSFENNPPCTTKNLLRPLGDKIAGLLPTVWLVGGKVGDIRAASGTVENEKKDDAIKWRASKQEHPRIVKASANSYHYLRSA